MLNYHYAVERAQKRMHGEDVYGHKISVGHPDSINISSSTSIPRSNWNSPKNGRKPRRELDMDEGYQTMGSAASWAGVPPIPLPPMPQFTSAMEQWNSQSQQFSRHFMNNSHEKDLLYNGAYKDAGRQSPILNLIQPDLNPLCTYNQTWLWDQAMKHDERWAGNKTKNATFVQKGPDGARRLRGTHGGPTGDPVADYQVQQQRLSVQSSRTIQPPAMTRSRTPNTGNQPKSFDATSLRRTRTPSPWQQNSPLPNYNTTSVSSDFENCFQPIPKIDNSPIELQVSNLDQTIEPAELRKILTSIFREHVQVNNVTVFSQSDGNMCATVKVPTIQDAQYAISRLHRRRVGYKRLLISYSNSATGPHPQLLRVQVVSLLQEVPGHSLPLFKFRESFESRYLSSVSMSELYRLRDVCVIGEDPLGRTVSLHPDHRNTPSPCLSGGLQENGLPQELPFCLTHCHPGQQQDKGWAEQEMEALPNVRIGLKALKANLFLLLESHNGCLPLPSLAICYEAEFGKTLIVDESGVPLEHLTSCIEGITIRQGVGTTKQLVWAKDRCRNGSDVSVSHTEDSFTGVKSVSLPLATQLALFSRELVDLLRKSPKCQILFNKFIPAYHHHFGRQCRVADYGFTKLIDLMEALTQTIQVMGEGNKRAITLSHKAQLRRFTSDLLRVLKGQASKQLLLSELPELFEKYLGRPWDVVEFGVCDLNDLLCEVNENTVVVTIMANDQLISIPKREQTTEEIERTTKFGIEVVELLKHAPQCSISFNKFVPSYHHHFGHQCRVSDYGFTKLIELFDSIPEIVKVEEGTDGERKVCVTPKYGFIVLREQLDKLLRNTPNTGVSLDIITSDFLKQFGYALKPDMFECETMAELLDKIPQIKLIESCDGVMLVSLVKQSEKLSLTLRTWRILLASMKMQLQDFVNNYLHAYGEHCDIYQLKDVEPVIQVSMPLSMNSIISLSPIYEFAAKAFRILSVEHEILPLHIFEQSYLKVYGTPIKHSHYGYSSLNALIAAVPEILIFKRHRSIKGVALNPNLANVGISLPPILSTSKLACNGSHINQFDPSNNIKSYNLLNGFHPLEQNASMSDIIPTSSLSNNWFENASNLTGKHFINGGLVEDIIYQNQHHINNLENVPNNQQVSNNIENNDSFEEMVTIDRGSLQNICIGSKAVSVSMKDINGVDENSKNQAAGGFNLLNNEIMVAAPPKPDTPPSKQESTFWGSNIWGPKEEPFGPEFFLQIDIPPTFEIDNYQLDELAKSLISPTLSLLQASDNPLTFHFGASHYHYPTPSHVQAPSPSLLPKPLASFVSPNKTIQQEEDGFANNGSGCSTPSRTKRKSRLAAYFQTPMED